MFKLICVTPLNRPSSAADKEILAFHGKPDGPYPDLN
jgi:hypothetical protein